MHSSSSIPKFLGRLARITIALMALSILYTWAIFGGTQSIKILITEFVVAGALFLGCIWFFFFSTMTLKQKGLALALLLGLAAFVAKFVKISEVTGDVMPVFTWSWTPDRDEGFSQENQIAKGTSLPSTLSEEDYPRFLGQNGNGVVNHLELNRNWEANPPEENWRIEVGPAWSGFAIAGNLAITQEQRGDKEMVICYDLQSGSQIWAHGDSQRFDTTVGGIGPRATPTIAGDKVFTFGALGLLNCLDLATGQLLWQRHTAIEHHAEKPRWGYSCSPLVVKSSDPDRHLVIVSPGGPDGHSLVAYHAENGTLVWNSGSAPPGYSSPQPAMFAGTDMILIFNHGSIAGHDPKTGELFWEALWPGDNACVANPRVLSGDRLLVSAGYGRGAKMYRIEKNLQGFQANILYESRRLNAKFANFVMHKGFAYGLDDGILTCMDAETGERVWKKGRYGHGQLLLVKDLLLLQAENGALNLIKAEPTAHERLASIPVLSGKSWNTMALAGNKLLMRNHKEAVCLTLPGKSTDMD